VSGPQFFTVEDAKARVERLTPARLRVLRLLAEGLSNAEIAERVHLSPHTISDHVRALRAGLRIGKDDVGRRSRNRVLMAVLAAKAGIV
jgi:DNA-binding NarL/FixJ family response regulator